MRGFEEKQTDRDEWQFIGPNPPGGRWTKKLANSNERIAKKCENLHFWAFCIKLAKLGPKGVIFEFLVKKTFLLKTKN